MISSKLLAGAALSTLITAASTSAALAQTAAPAAPQADVAAQSDAQDEIIVTGSRLGRTSFNSPTPVNVVGQDRAQNLNITNVGDALNQIPSFRPVTTPATNSFRVTANIAARSLDLRGLGTTRTLTLIDGRRNVPSADDNTFDLNAIPSAMIQRSEVVTGGASAAYGADAVSGVVNLILDTRFKGVKGEFNYGTSQRGDARSYFGSLMTGMSFAEDRGHFIAGVEYADEGGIGDYNSRRWSKRYHSFIPNPFFSTNPALSNGLPANVAIDNVLYVLNPAGVISLAGPFQGTQFDGSGNLIPFRFGDLFNRARPSALMVGGDPSVQDLYGFNKTPLMVATNHVSALGHLEYELTDSITGTAELSYARVVGGPTFGSVFSDQNGAITIRRDNPYLAPSVAAMMDAAAQTTLRVNRSNAELGFPAYKTRNQTWRSVLALKGKLGGSWRWDAFYTYGQTKGRQTGTGLLYDQRWKDAVDAVRAPAGVAGIAAGTIICRTTITNPANGCVPTNVMGAGKINAGTVSWVTGNSWQTRTFRQHHIAANLRGTLFQGWAGPIGLAVGGEYRTNSAEGDVDAAMRAGLFTASNANALPRILQKATEGYAEINVPIFKDFALGKSFEVDGAVRRTRYSLSGSATTWKVGGVWELSDDYMVRVTRSHDIRAPSPQELNPNTRSLTNSLADPKLNLQYLIPAITGGNPDLKLEKANTFTAGIVLKPRFLPRFRLSLDYYDIKVDGAIDIVNNVQALAICRSGTNPSVCTIGTDSLGNQDRILQLFTTYQNVAKLNARGLELVVGYSVPVAKGSLNISLNGNYVDTLSTTPLAGAKTEYAGATGNPGSVLTIFGVPRWRTDAVVGFERPTFAITSQFRYVPKGILNRLWVGPQDEGYSPYLANSVSDNRVAARLYVSLNARVKLYGEGRQKVEVFGGINNLFDKDPPSNLRFTGNGLYYDPIGRAFKVGLRGAW